ncbi:MAG: NADPH-dependent FMN reductase [Actinophytocola sp.]|nr:NADPH-dependent FMN reductase [Actinophytocola sp.]
MVGVVGHRGCPSAAEVTQVGLDVGDLPQVAVDKGELSLRDLVGAVFDHSLKEAGLAPEVVVDGPRGDIGIIIGTTRPRRRGGMVAHWVREVAEQHARTRGNDTTYELVDHELPLLDETSPAIFGEYLGAHTRRWAETIGACDGFVFVTPEYNHSTTAPLKNAIDYLFAEWNDKAAGFVSYGIHGGTRAVEHLRLILGELSVADVRTQVALSMFTDFEISDPREPGTLAPSPHQEPTLTRMLDELGAWSRALEPLRVPDADDVSVAS